MSDSPIILLDSAEDGCCESLGWVEATVDEDRARDQLAEFCFDEDGETPCRPDCGPARKVTLAPSADPATTVLEDVRWYPVDKLGDEFEVDDLDARRSEAREFWEVPVV